MIGHYTRIGGHAPAADILTPLAVFCGGRRGRGTPESFRALQRLVELVPDDAVFQADLAISLLDEARKASSPSPDPQIRREAERALASAEALDPAIPEVAFARYQFAMLNQRPLSEQEMFLRSGLDRRPKTAGASWGYQLNLGYLGLLLNWTGRFDAAMPYLEMASDADPFSLARRSEYVRALVYRESVGVADEIARIDARWGSESTEEIHLIASVISGAGHAADGPEAPPRSASSDRTACGTAVDAALQPMRSRSEPSGATEIKACLTSGRLSEEAGLLLLVKLGDLDGAFELAASPAFRPQETPGFGRDGLTDVLFRGPTRAMRADPRFLPLMERLGLMDYWRATNSRPDICADESVEVCSALRQAAPR